MKQLLSLNKIYISNSKIPNAGKGVFAATKISKGETIESCPFLEIPKADLTLLEGSMLISYFYFFGKTKERVLLPLGFGSLYNHSYTPNAVYKIKPNKNLIEFIATKDIQKNTEILVNYVQGNKNYAPLWFEV